MGFAGLEYACGPVVVAVAVDGADLFDEHVGQRAAALGRQEPFCDDGLARCGRANELLGQVEVHTEQRAFMRLSRWWCLFQGVIAPAVDAVGKCRRQLLVRADLENFLDGLGFGVLALAPVVAAVLAVVVEKTCRARKLDRGLEQSALFAVKEVGVLGGVGWCWRWRSRRGDGSGWADVGVVECREERVGGRVGRRRRSRDLMRWEKLVGKARWVMLGEMLGLLELGRRRELAWLVLLLLVKLVGV